MCPPPRPTLGPKLLGYFDWVNAHVVPTRGFVSFLVKLVMMRLEHGVKTSSCGRLMVALPNRE